MIQITLDRDHIGKIKYIPSKRFEGIFTYFLWMLKIYYVKIEAGRKIIYKFTKEIIFGTRIYVQILVLQGFVELSDVVKSGGIYSVRNAFATRLQQKYLKNIGHFSVIGTGECPFCYADFVSAVTLSSFSKILLIASTRTCISK